MTRTQPDHPSRLGSTASDPKPSNQPETPGPGFASTTSSEPCRPTSSFERSANYNWGYNDAFIAMGNASAANNIQVPSSTVHAFVQTHRKFHSHTSKSESTSGDGSSGTSISYPSSIDSSSVLTSSWGFPDQVHHQDRNFCVPHGPVRSSRLPSVHAEFGTPTALIYPRQTGVCGIISTVVTQHSEPGIPVVHIHGRRYFPNFPSPHSRPIHRPTTSGSRSYQPSSSNSYNNTIHTQFPQNTQLRQRPNAPTLSMRSASPLVSASNDNNVSQRDSLQQHVQPLYRPDLQMTRGYGYDWPAPTQIEVSSASTASCDGIGSGEWDWHTHADCRQPESSIQLAEDWTAYHGGTHTGDVPACGPFSHGPVWDRPEFNGYEQSGVRNRGVGGPGYGFRHWLELRKWA
ncbi:hypothetical protein IFR05_005807 [Cadophora sp. M221]|nr:hypothetical protein IFR05_005807 [Cadophora sp. M221]